MELVSNFVSALLKNPINQIFFYIIVTSLAVFLLLEIVLLLVTVKPRYRVVKKMLSSLKLFMREIGTSGESSLLLEQKKHRISNKVWHALIEHLKGSRGNGDEGFVAELKNRRFIFLQYPSVLLRQCPPSPLRFVPAFLTAIGVLGTFLGIYTGLKEVSIDSIDKPELLFSSSIKLLDGMKVAFGTSLVGLTGAVFFMLILFGTSMWRRATPRGLRKKFDSLAYCETPTQLLWRLNPEENRKSAEALKEVAEGFSPQIIGKAVAAGINHAIQENLAPVFQDIREELGGLRKIKTDQGEKIVERLVRELDQHIISPFVKRLDEDSVLVKNFSTEVNKVSEKIGQVTENLSSTVVTIKDFQEGSLRRMEAFASDLKISLMEFSEDSRQSFKEMSANIKDAVESSAEGMEKQRTAFEVSAEKASETFRGIRADLEEALKSQATEQKVMLDEVKAGTKDILDKSKESFQEQTSTLEGVGREASRLMEEAKENLLQGLQDIGGALDEIREKGTDELKNFMSAYQSSLGEFFSEQNKSLEEVLGRQRDGLSEVIQELQTVFRDEFEKRRAMSSDVDQSMVTVKDAAQEVGKLVDAVGLSSSARFKQLQIISSDIGKQIERVDNSYKNAIQQLSGSLSLIDKNYENLSNHFGKCLIDGNRHLNEYFKKAENSLGNFFKEADAATEKLCAKLYEMAAYLVDAEHQRRLELPQAT